MWMADGYMSRTRIRIRASSIWVSRNGKLYPNSVKATVDAYYGRSEIYVFAPNDVLIEAYERLFPNLSTGGSHACRFAGPRAIPGDALHAQAEIYRTFHMRDPEAFYNRADLVGFGEDLIRQAAPRPPYRRPTWSRRCPTAKRRSSC